MGLGAREPGGGLAWWAQLQLKVGKDSPGWTVTCWMRVVLTRLPNSRNSPGAARMSLLMALPPQVHPLMLTVKGAELF